MNQIESLRRTAEGEYCVEILLENVRRSFTFHVLVHKGIEMVTWNANFDRTVAPSAAHAEQLYAVVLAFHQAQRALFPSRGDPSRDASGPG